MAVLSIAVTVDESLPFWKYLSEKEKYTWDIIYTRIYFTYRTVQLFMVADFYNC